MLVSLPEIQALVASRKIGRGQTFPEGFIFFDNPHATVEKLSHRALIVVTYGGPWQAPNAHNTVRFLRVNVDVWASPTRATDGGVQIPDADDLIEEVAAAFLPYMHTVNVDVPGRAQDAADAVLGTRGLPRVWGTPTQVSTRSGTVVLSSELLGFPEFSDVRDGNGARMARYVFGVSTI